MTRIKAYNIPGILTGDFVRSYQTPGGFCPGGLCLFPVELYFAAESVARER